jgi:hypothetical protein
VRLHRERSFNVCDLKLKAIKGGDGKKYGSTTNWTLTHYGRTKDSASCTTDAFTATVNIVYQLPRWARDGMIPMYSFHD